VDSPTTSRPGLPPSRTDSAELRPQPAAPGLPGDRGYRDGAQHFVGGLHESGFLKVEREGRCVGHLAAVAVWHFQNDA
jgi:hypothetical protein